MIEATRPSRQRPKKGTDDGPLLPLDGRFLAMVLIRRPVARIYQTSLQAEHDDVLEAAIIDSPGPFRRDTPSTPSKRQNSCLLPLAAESAAAGPVNARFDLLLLAVPLPRVLSKRMAAGCCVWCCKKACDGSPTALRGSDPPFSTYLEKFLREVPWYFYSSLLARTSGPTALNTTPKHLHRPSKRTIGCLLDPFFDG